MKRIPINKLIEETKKLISIPSYEDCTEIQEYLKNRLDFINFEKQFVDKHVNGKKQYNLINIDKNKPFLINTHVDTVPPINMKEPFVPKEMDGKIYGRGAADTKGLIASLIIALETFKEENPDKEIPVSIAFTVDEENHTALGSEKLMEVIDGIKTILVLEPTYGIICDKQMGTLEFELNIKVDSNHASEFEKTENPAKLAFKYIENIEKKLKRPVNIINFQSGWEYYAVPEQARVLAEIKIFEGERFEELEKNIKELSKFEKFKSINYRRIDVENFLKFKKFEGFEYLKNAYKKSLNKLPKIGIMPSWTDAANYYKKNVETVVFGFGSLKDAHTKRENISIEDLKNMTKVLYTFFSILTQSQRS